MSKYQGQTVTNVRAAKQGDSGFDASKDQVDVTLPDGSHKVVLRTEVTEA